MQPLEASELKAFILALSLLDAPLPDDVQAKVNEIMIPGDLNKLYAIASLHPPLATAYDQVWEHLDAIAQVRSKGVEITPEYVPPSLNPEIDNSSRDIESALVKLEQERDRNKLVALYSQILSSVNSVKTAKDVIQTILSQS